ncbi:MAG: purine-nucleoside phosphorylase [Bdellovibrio sp.]|nr:purine-nucleoside phosphorylase [Bdellovibrio sp.]
MKETVAAIERRSTIKPSIGVILGSGLGSIAEKMTEVVSIPYAEIPHFYPTSVEGHTGLLLLGKLSGVPVVMLQGRFHFYEGYSMEEVVFPTRTICALGIQTLILTNAAGGINTQFRPGDLMIIEDHINLMGDNPLKGPNLSQLGPRFPDLSEAYSKVCIETFKSAANEHQIPIKQGIYAGLLGPTYETPAEVRMLRTLGVDAVGMSTVPESIAANHLGVQVCGVSCITNLAAGLSPHKLSHQEVMEVSKVGAEKLKRLLTTVIPRLTHKGATSQ